MTVFAKTFLKKANYTELWFRQEMHHSAPAKLMSSDPSLSFSENNIQISANLERQDHLSFLFLLQYMYFNSSTGSIML